MNVQSSHISSRKQVYLPWIMSLILSLLALHVHAQEEVTNEYDFEEVNIDCTDLFPEDETQDRGYFSFLDVPHETLSTGLESMARGIDEFFANEKVFYESSGSYVRYSIDNLWEEGGQVSTRGELKISLHLRRTEEKLKVVLESDPVETQDSIERVTKTPGTVTEKDKNYYAGVQREYGQEDKWRFKPSLGIKLHFPIEYYFRVRAYRDFNYEKWKLHLADSVYWFDTTGGGFETTMEWNRLLGENVLFRTGSTLRYTEENEWWDISQVFSIYHTLSERRAITYTFGVFGISKPSIHTTDYVLSARYRQILHSDYLFFEVVPQMRYRVDYGFREEDSILFRLEWLFQR